MLPEGLSIRVENLSKKYRIGIKDEIPDNFLASVGKLLKEPIKNLKRLKGLTRFSDREEKDVIWALKDISFEVKQGEVLGIIGPNGAGKSTLLKILSRITEPTSGSAIVRGRVGSLLEVGTGMHPELTGRENIYLSGTILGMKKAEIDRKFEEIVEFAELSKFIDTPIKRYSSGMRVRLGFAIAAHLEPEVLLVDEVLAVGDVAFQRKSIGRMGKIAREGRTVLFVSHNMAAIESLCNRVIYLREGKIVKEGKPDEVITAYLKEYADGLPYSSLERHPGRRRGMEPVLKGIRLLNKEGKPQSVFRVGESILFEIDLDPRGERYGKPRVSLSIRNSLGIQVSKLATWIEGIKWEKIDSRARAKCLWKDCRLVPGLYYVNVSFSSDIPIVDYVENAISFYIEEADIYGSGKLGTGIFLPDFHWEIKPYEEN